MWKCPQCGEENKDAARLCGLCGQMRPEEKPQEIVTRALGPAPAPPPSSLPVTQPASPGRDAWDEAGSRYLSEEEKKRLAEEAAARIMGQPAQKPAMSGVGCGPVALFIMFLPWSLFVLPMPGGLKNKKAMNVLLGIGCAVILISLLASLASLPWLLNQVSTLGKQYQDAAGG